MANIYLNTKMPQTELLIFSPKIALPMGSPFQFVSTSSFVSCSPGPNSWNYPLFLTYTLLFFFNFYFYFILLYNTVLVLPYIDMNPPRVYMRSQTWTPLTPPSPQHPSGSSQCTSPKHAVSCIRHRLAIRFLLDSIHVSMPFSQIIPLFSADTINTA